MSAPALPVASPLQRLAGRAQAVADLAKVRLSSLVLLTTGVGYALGGGEQELEPVRFGATLLGTALCAFGANAFNQWVECPWDQRMARTRGRPIPSGRLSEGAALGWASGFLVAGGLLLTACVNALAALLALAVAALYVLFYTPLKRRSSLCTLVGAVCGALPPVIGWVGASGALAPGAWVLFGILFVWQIPHFLAIDWYYRRDYHEGGYAMLSRVDPSGRMTGRQAVLYCLALLPISLMAVPLGLGGVLYLAGALALGAWFLAQALLLNFRRSSEAARGLFVASLAYLPALLLLLVCDPTR